jgi:hypothetical protein
VQGQQEQSNCVYVTNRYKESQWLAFKESIGQFYASMGKIRLAIQSKKTTGGLEHEN